MVARPGRGFFIESDRDVLHRRILTRDPCDNGAASRAHRADARFSGRTVATYLGPDGKLFRFKVEAFDDAGPIGDGEHTRAIVTTSRPLAGAAKRLPYTR